MDSQDGDPERRARGRRDPHRIRHLLSIGLARTTEALEKTPPGRWLHDRLRRSVEFTSTEVPLASGGSGLAGLEVAFLSDLHAGHFMTAADLESILERLAVLQPDLVCFGGDLTNTDVRELALYRAALRKITPPLGTFAIPGNHDYFRPWEIDRWRGMLEDMGVSVLDNSGVRIEREGAGLWLAGVDDKTEGEPDLDAALEGRRAGEPVLLLSHHPDLFVESSRRGVDLQLSGHTHGGQILVFGWAPITHSSHGFVAGLYTRGEASLYVGRGVGVTGLPLRIGTKSEVAILRLRR